MDRVFLLLKPDLAIQTIANTIITGAADQPERVRLRQ